MDEHEQQPEQAGEAGERGAASPPPRIWVGSLGDYNAGRLHGQWIDATQEPDQLHEAVRAMLRSSPTPGAEEWGIFDYDSFHGVRLDEYESLELVSQLACGITEHGGAFAAWAKLVDNQPEALDRFDEAYIGRFDSRAAFAQHIVDELADWDTVTEDVPGWLVPHVSIDYEALARDMELSLDIRFADSDDGQGGVWVFEGQV